MIRWEKVCAALVAGLLAAGCTPPLEKVQKTMAASVEECRTAKGEGPFVEVSLFGKDNKVKLLREACNLPITDVVLVDEIHAGGKTGPYNWRIKLDDESDVWVLVGVDWELIEDIREMESIKDPTLESLIKNDGQLKEAQELVPKSEWLRLVRLDNALKIRAKQRKMEDDPGIGEHASAIYKEVLEWAKAEGKPQVAAEAQLKVIRSLKRYQGQMQDALDGLGQQDDWLIKAIDLAKKERAAAKKAKNKEEEQKQAEYEKKYTEELSERRAKRPAEEARLKGRVEALNKLVCEQVAQLNVGVITDEELKKSAEAAKATKCM